MGNADIIITIFKEKLADIISANILAEFHIKLLDIDKIPRILINAISLTCNVMTGYDIPIPRPLRSN